MSIFEKAKKTLFKPLENENGEPEEVVWICGDCGNTKNFRTITYYEGDYDCQCVECNSLNTGEAGSFECKCKGEDEECELCDGSGVFR